MPSLASCANALGKIKRRANRKVLVEEEVRQMIRVIKAAEAARVARAMTKDQALLHRKVASRVKARLQASGLIIPMMPSGDVGMRASRGSPSLRMTSLRHQ